MIGRTILTAVVVGLTTPTQAEPCQDASTVSVRVTTARDGRTVMLDDGRELRLAAIEAPADASALHALTSGNVLHLSRVSEDRYGRVVAFATVQGTTELVQISLLAAGRARVSARIGDKTCADALFTAERTARLGRQGLWADPNFAPLSSQNLTMLAAGKGQFLLVEGRVLSVRESGATIYVNFGTRWSRDFAVTIPKRETSSFATAGVEPKKLERRRIRVRGILEQRAGPVIDVTVPEQIELID